MENISNDFTHIKGWGIDADPENEPTYPMKNYTGDDHKRLNWQRPPLQAVTVEVLKSIERPNISAVFGTPAPPSGLSGAVRRYAFQYSESSYGHWLPLMLADRINVVEGIVDDLRHGHVPNIFAEKGWKAAWKFNRKELITRVAVKVVLASAVAYWLLRKDKSKLE